MIKAVAVGISILASLLTASAAAASANEAGTAGTAGALGVPEALGAAGAADLPDALGAAGAADLPDALEAADSADLPGVAGPSGASGPSDAAGLSEASSLSGASGLSDDPGSALPDAPRLADRPCVREVVDLNYWWRFHRGEIAGDAASAPGYDDSAWEVVNLPHNPQVDKARQTWPNYSYEGVAWYRRLVRLDERHEGRKVFLELEAAGIRTDVWVNGTLVTTHYGQYLPIVADVTDHLHFDGTANVIAVKADNTDDPDTPIGNANWFNWGGIHRDVRLHITSRVHITDPIFEGIASGGGIFVTFSDVSRSHATVNVETHVRNENSEGAGCTLKTSIIDPSGIVVAEMEDGRLISGDGDFTFEQSIAVENPLLWHPDHPHLYTLRSEVYSHGIIVDRQDIRIGIRTIRFDSDNGFMINGERLVFRGANRMADYPYVGYAMPNSGQVRDAIKLKEAGFQAVRTAHYPQDPAFLDACDELGLMVIAPIPGFQYVGGRTFRERSYQDMRDLIRRDRNRPSVILWELSLNETDFDYGYATDAVKIGHEEYPTDQCYIAGWKYDNVYDVYLRNADHTPGPAKYFGQAPIVISEYGHWGYGGSDSTSDVSRKDGEAAMLVQARNHQESLNKNLKIPFLSGDALWAGIDLAAYDSGVLDNFRLPKFSYYFYQSRRDPSVQFGARRSHEAGDNSLSATETDAEMEGGSRLDMPGIDSGPMVYIASYWTEKSSLDVTVYSNCEEVELFLNGKPVERRAPDTGPTADSLPHPPFTFSISGFEPGELRAVGFISGREAASHVVRTPGEPTQLVVSIDTTGCAPIAGCSDSTDYIRTAECVQSSPADRGSHSVVTDPRSRWASSDSGLYCAADGTIRRKAQGSSPVSGKNCLFVFASLCDAFGTVVRTDNFSVIDFEISGPGKLISPATIPAEAGVAAALIETYPATGEITVTAIDRRRGLQATATLAVSFD